MKLTIKVDLWLDVEGFDSKAELLAEWPLTVIEDDIRAGVVYRARFGLADVLAEDIRILTEDEVEEEIRGVSRLAALNAPRVLHSCKQCGERAVPNEMDEYCPVWQLTGSTSPTRSATRCSTPRTLRSQPGLLPRRRSMLAARYIRSRGTRCDGGASGKAARSYGRPTRRPLLLLSRRRLPRRPRAAPTRSRTPAS